MGSTNKYDELFKIPVLCNKTIFWKDSSFGYLGTDQDFFRLAENDENMLRKSVTSLHWLAWLEEIRKMSDPYLGRLTKMNENRLLETIGS